MPEKGVTERLFSRRHIIMNNPSLTHPTDAELLAYLDDDAQWTDHIRHCADCQTRLQELRSEETMLTAQFHRVQCPDPLELGEYALHLLSGPRQNEIKQHMASCPHCSTEVSQLQDYLKLLVPVNQKNGLQTAAERVRVLVARLLSGPGDALLPPALQPAMAGIRGASTAPQIFEAGDFQIVIETQGDVTQSGIHSLLGLLLGDTPPENFEVQLWQEGTFVAKDKVDAFGNFNFEGLQSGAYDLKLLHSELEIRVNTLKL